MATRFSHQSKLDRNEHRALQAFGEVNAEKPKDVASSIVDRLVARGLLVETKFEKFSEGKQKFVQSVHYRISKRGQRMVQRYQVRQ